MIAEAIKTGRQVRGKNSSGAVLTGVDIRYCRHRADTVSFELQVTAFCRSRRILPAVAPGQWQNGTGTELTATVPV